MRRLGWMLHVSRSPLMPLGFCESPPVSFQVRWFREFLYNNRQGPASIRADYRHIYFCYQEIWEQSQLAKARKWVNHLTATTTGKEFCMIFYA